MAAKLTITLDQTEHALADRAERMKRRSAPMELDAVGRSIHFLRGVNSRAMMTLPAFYLFLGANTSSDKPCAIKGYPGLVFKHAIRACVPGCGGNAILRYASMEFFFHNCLITNDLKSAKA
jgi:hypothetical protein